MEPLPMSFSQLVSTGATILANRIASTSTTGWRTIELVWRDLICLNEIPAEAVADAPEAKV